MKHLIIGTAGHVDHGKTLLVKALTGVDTDRLKEEKTRGISIELGFAELNLPSGRQAGIIDVPGHERFIKNMLAGVGSIDIVILVIAADEGIMPQTREHLDIISLLNISHGIVVISKIDLVDEEWLSLVEEEVRDFLKGTVLEGSPILKVSALNGSGIKELINCIDTMAADLPERSVNGQARLPIDRVFTIMGFGTVVTGTLLAGRLTLGMTVDLLPRGLNSKIRSMQVHGQKVETAVAGQRVAVNLTGVEVSDLARGDVLAEPGVLQPSYRLDAELFLLPSAPKPMANRTRVRFHLGTKEALGRVVLLNQDELEPGKYAYVQLVMEEPVVAAERDRFVIRSYSPMVTIGGGLILDANPPKHKRFNQDVIAMLATRKQGSSTQRVAQYLENNKDVLPTSADIAANTGLNESEVARVLDRLQEKGTVIRIDGEGKEYFLAKGTYQLWWEELAQQLRSYHQQFPLRSGLTREEIRSKKFPWLNSRVFNFLLQKFVVDGFLAVNAKTVALAGFAPRFDVKQESDLKEISRYFSTAGWQPPSWSEIVKKMGLQEQAAQEYLQYLLENGVLIKINEDIYLHHEALKEAREMLVAHLQEHGEVTLGEVRDLWQTSRKYALPLLEYFDLQRVTRRIGDKRILYK